MDPVGSPTLPLSVPSSCFHSTPSLRSRTVRSAGFSLVELVMAIGIVSFAFVSLFALLPVGLTTFRQTMDTSIGSQIVQRIVNEAQQTDYPTLINTTSYDRYFDDQGNEVQSIDSSIYTVEVTVTAPTSLPNTSTPDSTSLATVMVKLANDPGHHPAPFDPGSKVPFSVYTAVIAKNQ